MQTAPVLPNSRAPKRVPTLDEILSYENDALVARYQKEFSLSRDEAVALFGDVKRFLWLGAVTDGPIAPPPKVDDGWHMFILFTEDYAEFCERFFGAFRHHRPTRPSDPPDGGVTVRRTVAALKEQFGGFEWLSNNWLYPNMMEGAGCWSSCSTPSTNCQDPACR